MRMDLGIDDKALLDLASRPRGARYRNTNTLSSAHSSTKLGAALAPTEDITEMKLDDRGALPDAAEDDSGEDDDDDDDDDSASVYQDTGSTVSSPPPTTPSTSAARSRAAISSPPGKGVRGIVASHGSRGPASDMLGPDALAQSSITQLANSQSLNGSGSGAPPTTGGGSKRGRKPAPAASRGAREQARKTNHSRIEKRRREKINEALATLREIVPVGVTSVLQTQSPGVSPALSAVGAASGKKKSQEKEFKLEVLERTVVFVKYLLDRVSELEGQTGHTASSLERETGMSTSRDILDAAGTQSSTKEEAGTSSKKRRRNENASSSVSALSPLTASRPVPERAVKRSRQTDLQNSGFPQADSQLGDNWPILPESEDGRSSAPLSPAATLAYSTSYSAMPTPSANEMNNGISSQAPGSERTSPATGNKATANTMSTESSGSRGGSRPRLPSIAAMLNGPCEVSSPSLLPSNGGPHVSPPAHSRSYPCSPNTHLSGPQRTSSSSCHTSPNPFQLPSSSLPAHGTASNSLIDSSGSSGARNHHAKRFIGRDVEDDEATAAATLLMRFSYDRNRTSDLTSSSSGVGKKGFQREQPYVQAQTPGSILGLGRIPNRHISSQREDTNVLMDITPSKIG